MEYILIIVSSNLLSNSQHIIYNGRQEFDIPPIESIPEITCSNNQFLKTTNFSHMTHYYRLKITSDIKTIHTSTLDLTTCCKFCDYTYDSLYDSEIADYDTNQTIFDKIYDMDYYTHWMNGCNKREFGEHQHVPVNLTHLSSNHSILDIHDDALLNQVYDQFCIGPNSSTLDTYLYILQEKKGELIMMRKSVGIKKNHTLIC